MHEESWHPYLDIRMGGSNARNIAKIKDNLCTLHQQNQLQDKQIKHLAKYLNLTMHQVDEQSEMLYEMDTKMLIMNKALQQIMWTLDAMRYESNLLHYFQNKIYRVYIFLYALQGDTESLFEYMRALASQELNPMIIPPDILKNILHKIETDIKLHARLKLCEDPETNMVILQNNKVDTHSPRRLPDANINCSFS